MYSIATPFDAVTDAPATPATAFGSVEGVGPTGAAYLYMNNASDTDIAIVQEGAIAASFFVVPTGTRYRIGPFTYAQLIKLAVWASAAGKTLSITPVAVRLPFTRSDRQNGIARASQEAYGTHLPEQTDLLPFVFEEIS